MKDRITKDGTMWECGSTEGTFEKNDGKRFCSGCGKMLREGNRVIENRTPMMGRRLTNFSYRHKDCENPNGTYISNN